MRQTTRTRWLGFSIVELMAVLAVIGILVSLALPRFRVFIARGRQAEAIHNLGIINKLQKSYTLRAQGLGLGDRMYFGGTLMGNGSNNNNCQDANKKNPLGFRVEDCDSLRYDYTARSGWQSYDQATNNGLSSSNLIYPGCSGAGSQDEWEMHKNGELKNTSDVVEDCAN